MSKLPSPSLQHNAQKITTIFSNKDTWQRDFADYLTSIGINSILRYELTHGEWYVRKETGCWTTHNLPLTIIRKEADKVLALLEAQYKASPLAEEDKKGIQQRMERLGLARKAKMASQQEIILKELQNNPLLHTYKEEWNNIPHVIGTPEGPLNLITGEIEPQHLITLQTEVSFIKGETPTYDMVMKNLTNDDEDLAAQIEMLLGKAMYGKVVDQKAGILIGPTGVGKSTIFSAVCAALGDYGVQLQPHNNPFVKTTGGRGSEDSYLAAVMAKARLILCEEMSFNGKFDSAVFKDRVDGKKVMTREIRGNPEAQLFRNTYLFTTNEMPLIRDNSGATQRRIHYIDIRKTAKKVLKQDSSIRGKIESEIPFILEHIRVNGFLRWYNNECSMIAMTSEAEKELKKDSASPESRFFEEVISLHPEKHMDISLAGIIFIYYCKEVLNMEVKLENYTKGRLKTFLFDKYLEINPDKFPLSSRGFKVTSANGKQRFTIPGMFISPEVVDFINDEMIHMEVVERLREFVI